MQKRTLIAILVVLAALVPVSIVVAGDRGGEPDDPEFVEAGKVKKPKGEPVMVAVIGPDGELVTCANGKPLKVKQEKLTGPPPTPPGQTESVPEGGYVWRCGKGANPHLDPQLIPAEEDPLRP